MIFKLFLIIISSIVLVNTFYIPNNEHPHNSLNEIPYKSVEDEAASPWSEVIVMQMHYDCRGLLVRQEMSKLKIRSGVARVPEEYRDKSLQNEVLKEEYTKPEVSAYFRSMPRRLRNLPIEPRQEKENSQIKPQFEPDRIIEVPIRPCPEGQKDDPTRQCKEVLPEF